MPDNTKVAVIKACLYEPQINRTYAEMAADYDTAILPARPRRPRDKAKVEVTMLIIERWLGHLRHWRFYSLAESIRRPGRTDEPQPGMVGNDFIHHPAHNFGLRVGDMHH